VQRHRAGGQVELAAGRVGAVAVADAVDVEGRGAEQVSARIPAAWTPAAGPAASALSAAPAAITAGSTMDRRRGRFPDGCMLERAAELGVITEAVSSAAGSGSVLLVEGEAGIGKTSLLGYACEQAARAGITVRAARAAEFEGGYAWAVVRQLFAPEVASGARLAAARTPGSNAPASAPGTSRSFRDKLILVC
jgi:hypothetical protein